MSAVAASAVRLGASQAAPHAQTLAATQLRALVESLGPEAGAARYLATEAVGSSESAKALLENARKSISGSYAAISVQPAGHGDVAAAHQAARGAQMLFEQARDVIAPLAARDLEYQPSLQVLDDAIVRSRELTMVTGHLEAAARANAASQIAPSNAAMDRYMPYASKKPIEIPGLTPELLTRLEDVGYPHKTLAGLYQQSTLAKLDDVHALLASIAERPAIG